MGHDKSEHINSDSSEKKKTFKSLGQRFKDLKTSKTDLFGPV